MDTRTGQTLQQVREMGLKDSETNPGEAGETNPGEVDETSTNGSKGQVKRKNR